MSVEVTAADQDMPRTGDSRVTVRGTPCARSWTSEWIARVEEREESLGRRICGARTIGHAPCPAPPSGHPSGRCAHHGGFDLTGAPEGNRNAIVHNLYARRLMPCGNHCPAWRSCPLGGGAADSGKEMLARAYPDRPTCPYEQAEYTAVVTDALRRSQNHHENAWGLHVAHQVALMTVLVSRAARALATHPFVEDVEIFQGEHHTITTKPAAMLIAYEKLARELRRWTILLERGYEWISCDRETALHHKHRQATDTSLDPDAVVATASYPEGQEPFNRRGRREGQGQGGQDLHDLKEMENPGDVGAGPCARPELAEEIRSAGVPPANAVPISEAESSPPPGGADLDATRERIHGYIQAAVPELLERSKISDPPGSGLYHILHPPP